ncbi:glutaredoxin family protein [Actinidia rufa]|uniref:Glutaredoxin family protein n=1 Tax=Actinidia rufa TaxID=165716 RepID=A0A7J0EL60_9ERIC|nr:glutaredoxin family protein [Actinidia rufa]
MAMSKAKELVATNPVVVFSKSYCPFCVSVKKLLTELGATYKVIELNTENMLRKVGEAQTLLIRWRVQRHDAHQTLLGVMVMNMQFYTLSYFTGDGSDIQAALAEWTGLRTVPNVFIGGNHIGGCDSTTAMHKGGKLIPLLTEAGAVTKSSTSS